VLLNSGRASANAVGNEADSGTGFLAAIATAKAIGRKTPRVIMI